MSPQSIAPKARQRKDSGRRAKTMPKRLTLADIRVTHTVGSHTTTRTGETIARLIEGTQHLHDRQSDDLDFLNASAIAAELDGLADILVGLSEAEGVGLERALPCVGDQLRRIAHRVGALAPASGNRAPDWYTVEVKK